MGVMRLCAALLALCLCLSLFPATLAAQTDESLDYESWTGRAEVAEATVERGQASTQALEDLRSEIATWRERFLAAQDVNDTRIQTLQAQIDALGPPPGEEATEPDALSERRAELNRQLAELRAPVLRAEEAFTRADGIITEIDAIIRERQTEALLEFGPSPLNPVHWTPAMRDLGATFHRSWREIETNFRSEVLRAQARGNLPLILLLAVIGLLLIFKGHGWSRQAVETLQGDMRRGTGVWRFLLSLGQILLPLVGIYALVQAAFAAEIFGTRMTLLLEQVPLWAAVLLGSHWLADQTLHEDDKVAALPLDPPDRRRARRLANILTVLLVLHLISETLSELDGYGPATEAVVSFPILLLAGLTLFRLGRLRMRAVTEGAHAAVLAETSTVRQNFARLWSRAAMAIGLLAPVLAAAGYIRIGEAMVYPAMLTLALFALVLVLQNVFDALYALVTGRSPDEADSLVPVLVGFVLAVSAIPLLALIWGARVADLTEVWARFQEGFQFGETRIQPTDFIAVAVVFALGYTLTRMVQGAMRSSVLPRTKMEPGAQTAIVSGLGYVGMAIAAIAAITAGGLDLSSLAIVAGALSVGIGFGLRTVVENFVSGIILLIERPISEGDWIEVGGQHGIVKSISVRSTRIETFDRFDLIVPNADLVAGQVRNYTRGNVLGRIIVPVSVAYGTDTRKVESILLGIARENAFVLMSPAPYVYFAGFGADGMDFEIRAVLRDVNESLGVRTEMNHEIAVAFTREGIEIPFAQRDIWLRNPEALRAETGAAAVAKPSDRPAKANLEAHEGPEDAE